MSLIRLLFIEIVTQHYEDNIINKVADGESVAGYSGGGGGGCIVSKL